MGFNSSAIQFATTASGFVAGPGPDFGVGVSLGFASPDITRMIDRLEEKGWISRTRSTSDRRAVLVAITESGLALLTMIADPLADCHRRQLSHLSESELKTLVELLVKARLPHEPPDSSWKQS